MQTAARQLSLFRSRRQRGTAPPAASEYQLHCAVVDTIKRWIMPGWLFMHPASGEKRDIVTAARLKKMGTCAGWPDLMLFGPSGEVCAIELKAKGGRLSEAQAAVKGRPRLSLFKQLPRRCRDLESLARAAIRRISVQ